MNVLFVGAHPDDIEYYCGGTVWRYKQMGAKLFFCVSTNGNIGSSTMTKEEIGRVRHEEAQKSAELAGAELIWLDYDDEFLMDTRETRMKFIEAFRKAQADVVICHWRDDFNPDHIASAQIVDDCIHMANVPLIKTESKVCDKIPHVYHMDTWAGHNFMPELFVDITDVFDKKVELLKCHESQSAWMMDIFGYDVQQMLELPAKWRGFQAGVKMAEAFRPSYRSGRNFIRHYLPDCIISDTGSKI